MPLLRIIRGPVRRFELAGIAEGQFGDMVKAVVDVNRRVRRSAASCSRAVEDPHLRESIRQIVEALVA